MPRYFGLASCCRQAFVRIIKSRRRPRTTVVERFCHLWRLGDWNKVIFNSLTMKGIYGRQIYDTWYRMSALLHSGLEAEIKKIITHRYDYWDFTEAFKVMRMGDSGKVILDWRGRREC